jgi:protease YdgD
MIRAALALCLGLAAGVAAAEDRRMLEAGEAEAFRAVGRLNIAGTRFCTATLISETLVLTAAHCLYHPRTGRAVPLEEFRFVPAHRIEENAGVWRVAQAVVLPGFTPGAAPEPQALRRDIALLELDAPVPPEAARPLPVGTLAPGDPPPAIVSYARSRAQAPSINPACPLIVRLAEVMVLSCAIDFGVSGAPVFVTTGDGPMLVAVVSAMGELPGGDALALAVTAEDHLEALRAALASR